MACTVEQGGGLRAPSGTVMQVSWYDDRKGTRVMEGMDLRKCRRETVGAAGWYERGREGGRKALEWLCSCVSVSLRHLVKDDGDRIRESKKGERLSRGTLFSSLFNLQPKSVCSVFWELEGI